jgi:hypothetical protein
MTAAVGLVALSLFSAARTRHRPVNRSFDSGVARILSRACGPSGAGERDPIRLRRGKLFGTLAQTQGLDLSFNLAVFGGALRGSRLNLCRPRHDNPAGDPSSFSRAEEPGVVVDPRGDQEPQRGRAIWQAQRFGQFVDLSEGGRRETQADHGIVPRSRPASFLAPFPHVFMLTRNPAFWTAGWRAYGGARGTHRRGRSPDGQSVSSVSTAGDSIISVPLLWILAPLGRIEFFATDFFEFQQIVLRELPQHIWRNVIVAV